MLLFLSLPQVSHLLPWLQLACPVSWCSWTKHQHFYTQQSNICFSKCITLTLILNNKLQWEKQLNQLSWSTESEKLRFDLAPVETITRIHTGLSESVNQAPCGSLLVLSSRVNDCISCFGVFCLLFCLDYWPWETILSASQTYTMTPRSSCMICLFFLKTTKSKELPYFNVLAHSQKSQVIFPLRTSIYIWIKYQINLTS